MSESEQAIKISVVTVLVVFGVSAALLFGGFYFVLSLQASLPTTLHGVVTQTAEGPEFPYDLARLGNGTVVRFEDVCSVSTGQNVTLMASGSWNGMNDFLTCAPFASRSG